MKTICFEKNIPKILITKFAAKYCKPLLFSKLNAVKYHKNIPTPALPAADWVRVRNIACGICGTDLSFFKSTAGTSIALEPMPGSERTFLGHETLGVVTEVGEDVAGYNVGDRVSMMQYMSACGTKGITPPCPACARGDYCLCENYGEKSPYDLPMTGAGFGSEYIAPQMQLFKLDDQMTDDQALMLEPAAVGLHAVLLAAPKEGENILVLGAGTIGLCVVQWLRVLYPTVKIHVLERVRQRAEFAKRLGADKILSGDVYEAAKAAVGGKVYEGMFGNKMLIGGYDRIFDCVGTHWAMHTCMRIAKARGTIVKVGHHMNPTKFDETPLWWQELTVVGVDAHGMEHVEGRDISTFALTQEYMLSDKFKVDGFITHRFPLDDYRKAFRLMLQNPPELVKIVLENK